MTDYILTGLVKRRAELTGQIEQTHEVLHKMLADLESLDATILQFDPGHRVEAFRPPKDWSNRDEMNRAVLSILRQAAKPLISADIVLEMLVSQTLDKAD